jgi:hypothetical protein
MANKATTPWTRTPMHWPQRGVPGGWRDVWEQDGELAAAIARAQRFADETEQVRFAWQAQAKPTIPPRPRPVEPSDDPVVTETP